MPSRQAWVESSIKRWGGVKALKVRLNNCLIIVENVSREQISVININQFMISLFKSKLKHSH